MTDIVLDDTGQRALITDLETGQVLRVSVPTARENVANGQGRFVHGEAEAAPRARTPQPTPAPEPVIQLTEPDVLPLPAEPAPAPAARPDQDKRNTDIAASLELLDEHDWVKTGVRAGRPKCSAVENIVGYPVFVDEIDPLWDARQQA